jgi:hypothetical protein
MPYEFALIGAEALDNKQLPTSTGQWMAVSDAASKALAEDDKVFFQRLSAGMFPKVKNGTFKVSFQTEISCLDGAVRIFAHAGQKAWFLAVRECVDYKFETSFKPTMDADAGSEQPVDSVEVTLTDRQPVWEIRLARLSFRVEATMTMKSLLGHIRSLLADYDNFTNQSAIVLLNYESVHLATQLGSLVCSREKRRRPDSQVALADSSSSASNLPMQAEGFENRLGSDDEEQLSQFRRPPCQSLA